MNLRLACLLFFPAIVIGQTSSFCQPHDFLKNGFNYANYRNCSSDIRQCPLEGPMPKTACVNKIIGSNENCKQLAKLAEVLQTSASALTVKQFGKLTLVDKLFIADGQHQYYLITAKGCLVNTNIDPRQLDKSLAEKYNKTNFMIVNWQKPIMLKDKGDAQTVDVVLRITDSCMACPVIGFATLRFEFSAAGQLTNTRVVQFKTS